MDGMILNRRQTIIRPMTQINMGLCSTAMERLRTNRVLARVTPMATVLSQMLTAVLAIIIISMVVRISSSNIRRIISRPLIQRTRRVHRAIIISGGPSSSNSNSNNSLSIKAHQRQMVRPRFL